MQTSIHDQRPKLKLQINSLEVKGLVDTCADITIIAPTYWHPGWPLQLQEIGTLSRVKQSAGQVKCIGSKGQIEKLKSYVANITMNLWGHNLLQQWKAWLNIPPIS